MVKQLKFKELKEKYLKTLEQYVPIVARVHGKSHPEFYEVKTLFEKIRDKLRDNSNNNNLEVEFGELKKVTNNYLVPADVCESYAAVYQMLEELDRAYSS